MLPYERVEMLCIEKGISIYKLEKDLEMARNTIKNWENGTSPTCKRINQVADYFDVSTDFLLGRTENRLSHKEQFSDGSLKLLEESERLKITIGEANILSSALAIIINGYREASKD